MQWYPNCYPFSFCDTGYDLDLRHCALKIRISSPRLASFPRPAYHLGRLCLSSEESLNCAHSRCRGSKAVNWARRNDLCRLQPLRIPVRPPRSEPMKCPDARSQLAENAEDQYCRDGTTWGASGSPNDHGQSRALTAHVICRPPVMSPSLARMSRTPGAVFLTGRCSVTGNLDCL